MADKVVGLRLDLDGDQPVKTMGAFRTQVREAQQELFKMRDIFGETSDEALKAAKRVAQLKDEMGDAAALADAFNPDRKFQAFSNSLRAVTGGFSALQGSMALFGAESEDVQKTLLKVQAAMAISEGVDNILEMKDTFKSLNAVVQQSAVFQKANAAATKAAAFVQKLFAGSVDQTATSFKFLKGAIAATGIGLLIVAIGEVVSALQSWASAAEDAAAAQKELDDQVLAGARTALQGELASIDRHTKLDIARAKSRGATEKEIFDIEQRSNRDRLAAQTRFYNEVKDKDVKQGIDTQEEIKKQNTELEIGDLNFKGEQRKRDEEERKRKSEKRKSESEKELAEQKQADEKLKDRIWEGRTAINELEAQMAEEKLQAKIDQEDNFRKMVEEKGGSSLDITGDLSQDQIDERVELVKQLTMSESEVRLMDLDDEYKRRFEIVEGNEELELGLKKWYAEEGKKIDDVVKEHKLAVYDSIGTGLGNLSALFKQGTAAAKIAALAEIAVGTGTGFIRALQIAQTSSLAGGPAAAFIFPALYASQIAAVLGAAARAKAILKGDAGGGNNISASAPSFSAPAAPIRPQQSTTSLDQNSLNAIGNAAQGGAVRAFVVETDMTNNQQRVAMLNRMARLD